MFVPEIYLHGAVLIALLTTVALIVLACLDRQMLRRMFGFSVLPSPGWWSSVPKSINK